MHLEDFIEIANQFKDLDQQTVQNIVYWVIGSSSILNDDFEKKLILSKFRFKNAQIHQIALHLIQRYKLVNKNEEEFMKFLFRKLFKFIKKNFEDNNKGMLRKQLNQKFFETYFIKKDQGAKDVENFRSLKKTKLVKMISNKYLMVLLSNDNLFNAFESFLNIFKDVCMKESQRKVTKIVIQILLLIENKQIEKIINIKNLPWIDVWMEKCKVMGVEIIAKIKLCSILAKKIKTT